MAPANPKNRKTLSNVFTICQVINHGGTKYTRRIQKNYIHVPSSYLISKKVPDARTRKPPEPFLLLLCLLSFRFLFFSFIIFVLPAQVSSTLPQQFASAQTRQRRCTTAIKYTTPQEHKRKSHRASMSGREKIIDIKLFSFNISCVPAQQLG